MKLSTKIALAIIPLISAVTGISQNCPSLGPDQFLPCGVNQTVLTANLTTCNPSTITANQTTTYSVTNIPFAAQPTVGATNVPLSDDSQAGPFNIGFSFCFFGNTYTQMYIGSNGWISFSAGQPVTFASSPIPSASGSVAKNCIMGPWQDWYPQTNLQNVSYQTLGTAPCRRLVVSWKDIQMYSCWASQGLGNFQIVIYEGTNLIENHIGNKPNCVGWSGGTGVQGLHNLAGTVGITVPGRNSTQWTTVNNAYRYSPAGAPVNPTLTWFAVGNPVPLGTGPTLTVTPPVGGQQYTCHFVYPACYVGFDSCIPNAAGNSPDTVLVVPGLAGINPTITAPTCINGPTQISVAPNSATNIVQWTGPGIIGSTTSPTITVNATGIYSVVISNAVNTCTGSASVLVSQTPTLNIASTTNTMCSFNSNGSLNTANLTASGATNYTWTNISGMLNTTGSNTATIISVTPIPGFATGSATLVGVNGPCSNTISFNIAIIPNPTIAVTSASVCQGLGNTLVASGAANYNWSPSSGLSATNVATVTANPNITTVYSVIGNNLGCNSTTQTTTLTVVPNPTITVTPLTNTICAGGNMNLTANGASTYNWAPNTGLNTTTGAIVNAGPASTTNYTVIGSAASCTGSAVYQVSVIIVPNLITTVSRDIICNGTTSNLNVNGANGYVWAPTTGLNSPTGAFVVASPPTTTNYTVTGFNGVCTASASVLLTVVQLPNLTISSPEYQICYGKSTPIYASGAQNYTWSPNNGLSSTTNSNVIATPSANINYTVVGYNQTGTVVCPQQMSYSIIVVPISVALVSPSIALCEGEKTMLTASGGNTILWTPTVGLSSGSGGGVIASPSVSTLYTVDVSYDGFCGGSNTVFVKVNPNPKVTAGRDTIINLEQPMFLSASGTGTMTWTDGEAIMCRVCPNSQVFATRNSCYTIETINDFGCKAKDEMCIEVTVDFGVYIPNSFTPNGDGINDEFLISGYNISDITMDVFDRWGEKLFTSKEITTGWKGNYKNLPCEEAVYIYKVTYKGLDGKRVNKTGHVTLNR
ncbi:MAG: gliding motility-associated C-terminal domain-containing protein [Bacteroidetes bacterium]|nr:gliding motility-associated C-terminal domain-containing protein [Bacteroidota bacterium]